MFCDGWRLLGLRGRSEPFVSMGPLEDSGFAEAGLSGRFSDAYGYGQDSDRLFVLWIDGSGHCKAFTSAVAGLQVNSVPLGTDVSVSRLRCRFA